MYTYERHEKVFSICQSPQKRRPSSAHLDLWISTPKEQTNEGKKDQISYFSIGYNALTLANPSIFWPIDRSLKFNASGLLSSFNVNFRSTRGQIRHISYFIASVTLQYRSIDNFSSRNRCWEGVSKVQFPFDRWYHEWIFNSFVVFLHRIGSAFVCLSFVGLFLLTCTFLFAQVAAGQFFDVLHIFQQSSTVNPSRYIKPTHVPRCNEQGYTKLSWNFEAGKSFIHLINLLG